MADNYRFPLDTMQEIRETLAKRCKRPPSDLGVTVAYILARQVGGLHNLERTTETDWTGDKFVEYLHCGDLATVDSDKLTRLVVMCHDAKIRFSISACNMRYVRFLFHRRESRGGSLYLRCPHIETVIADVREKGDLREEASVG